jgi:tetratricopeptide (TPR) repeat protein
MGMVNRALSRLTRSQAAKNSPLRHPRWSAVVLLLVFLVNLPFALLADPAQSPAEETPTIESLLAQASLAANRKDYRQAAALYQAILKTHPNLAEIWSNLGMMHQFLGDEQSAVHEFKVAVRENPRLFVPNLFLGLDRIQNGDPSGALPYLKRAEQIYPGDEQAALSLGQAYEALGDFPRGDHWFYRAATINPENPEAWYDLGSIYLDTQRRAVQGLDELGKDSPYARLLVAQALIEQGKLNRAIGVLCELTTGDHPVPDAHAMLSLAYSRQHDLVSAARESKLQAKDQTERCHGTSSSNLAQLRASGLLRAAQCAYWSDDYQTSLSASEALSALAPHSVPALYWQAKSAGKLAMDSLRRAHRLAPDSVQSEMLTARIDLDQGRFREAATEYAKALQASGNSPEAELGLATTHYLDFQLDEAMTEARRVLAAEPRSAQANLLMGEILLRTHRDKEAIPYLTTALQGSSSEDTRVHALLAQCYAGEGRAHAAIEEWRQALPGDIDGSFHYQLYRLYLKVGDHKDAALVLQESLKLWKHQAQPRSQQEP